MVGNQVVIGLEHEEGELGIYFPTDGQLSPLFCSSNNLYRDSSLNSNKEAKPGMFDNNRRVRAQKFRGEKSDGFWVPLSLLSFTQHPGLGFNNESLEEGKEFTTYNGVEICNKYMTQATINAANNQPKKNKTKTSIMFKEHFDTEHFGKNVNKFKYGQYLIVTEKVHGTSGRIGYVLVDKKLTWKERIAKNWFGIDIKEQKWDYLNGTRRVVIEESNGIQFHDPTIRDYAFNTFRDNLHKGETVFFEIVGFEPNGTPIMPSVATKKLNDKEFTTKYGEQMVYSYGCEPTKCEVYVYRITNTNEAGLSIDLSWNDVKTRCNEIGVKYVPEVLLAYIKGEAELLNQPIMANAEMNLIEKIEEVVQGPSLLDGRHIREGVCIRIEGLNMNPEVYKHKSFEFKVLEGIVKDTGVVDEEEQQSMSM